VAEFLLEDCETDGNTALLGNVDLCRVLAQILVYPPRITQGVIEILELLRIGWLDLDIRNIMLIYFPELH
jgi:hypothetical protein